MSYGDKNKLQVTPNNSNYRNNYDGIFRRSQVETCGACEGDLIKIIEGLEEKVKELQSQIKELENNER